MRHKVEESTCADMYVHIQTANKTINIYLNIS